MIPEWVTLDAGADAAEDLLEQVFGVARKQQSVGINPLTGSGFEKVLRLLLGDLLTVANRADKTALKRVLAVVDSDWPGISPMEREARLRDMAKALGGVPEVLVPQVERVLAAHGPRIVADTKSSATSTYELPIRASLNLVDQRIVDAARRSQTHYVRNEYGRREERASEVARDVVAKGLERGLDRYAIAEELKPAMEAIGVQRSVGYFGMIASVFAARARTWGTIAAFDEAGLASMEWVSQLDEATSDTCRFLDGKVFPVAAAKQRFEQVAAAPDPEAVVELQPWVSAGKAKDGSVALYYKQGGERRPIAMVERSGVGAKDDRGEYSRAAATDKLIAAGITSPPAHAHCRSLLVPASNSSSSAQVPAGLAPRKPAPAPSFDDLARTVSLTGVKALNHLGAENVNPVFTARLGETDVYAKPGHVNLDVTEAVARHRAVATTAEALGAGQMVMPAALVRSEEALREAARAMPSLLDPENGVSSSMFVTRAAPSGAVPAYAQDPRALARVSDADRLVGALVDFLHANADRHDGNVLVDDRGRMVLIDHDATAEAGVPSSVFFPGGGLSYAQQQRRLSDLPEALRTYVSGIADSDIGALRRAYSLSEEAAAAMKARAQSVVSGGLDAALVENGAQWQSVGASGSEDRMGDVVVR